MDELKDIRETLTDGESLDLFDLQKIEPIIRITIYENVSRLFYALKAGIKKLKEKRPELTEEQLSNPLTIKSVSENCKQLSYEVGMQITTIHISYIDFPDEVNTYYILSKDIDRIVEGLDVEMTLTRFLIENYLHEED